jgi:hypothetical protein
MKIGLATIWLFVPAVIAVVGWWSYLRSPSVNSRWRAGATSIALGATSANVVILTGLAALGALTMRMPVQINMRTGGFLVVVGYGLCAASAIAAVVGRGRLWWLILPAALIQCDAWLMVSVAMTAY